MSFISCVSTLTDLVLEIQAVISYLTWMLGLNLGTRAQALLRYTLKHETNQAERVLFAWSTKGKELTYHL